MKQNYKYMMLADKLKLPKELDKRRKLTNKDRERIKRLYFKNGLAIRVISREYKSKCSRRLIQFVLFPERELKLREMRKVTKAHLKYYNREKHNACVKDLRARKKELFNL